MHSIRFAVGVALMLLGYTALYVGQSNMASGGHGATFLEAMGFTAGPAEKFITTAENSVPNLSGNTPQTQPPPSPGVIQGQFYFGP